jgi:hypothetical protein
MGMFLVANPLLLLGFFKNKNIKNPKMHSNSKNSREGSISKRKIIFKELELLRLEVQS